MSGKDPMWGKLITPPQSSKIHLNTFLNFIFPEIIEKEVVDMDSVLLHKRIPAVT